MTRPEKLKQFFEFLPKDRNITEFDYREVASKIGDITEIADAFIAHAKAHNVDISGELENLRKARTQVGLNESTAVVKPFSDIEPEEIKWLWEKHIAIGKLTIFAGDPGLGKSQGTLDIAARLSRGDCFPDGSLGILGDTIILSGEDGPGETIRPRLDVLNADVSHIHILQGELTKDGKIVGMTLEKVSTFLDAINQIRIQGREVKLLIIDPFNGFMGDGDSNSNEDTRKATDAICSLAEQEGFSIVGDYALKQRQRITHDQSYGIDSMGCQSAGGVCFR